eukprot:3933317-Rhodomonas_salina.1
MVQVFFFLSLAVPAAHGQCTATIPVKDVVEGFQSVMPTADGSVLEVGADAVDVLVHNIRNNVRAIGADMTCTSEHCTFTVWDTPTHTRLFLLAILGNFLNQDIEKGDALAHLQLDTATCLLRRTHTTWWARMMLSDVLLVLAVFMLARRALQDSQHTHDTDKT